MPQICTFAGITVLMRFADHNPPHFHVEYGDHEAMVALDGTVLEGGLPTKQARMVRRWALARQAELAVAWGQAVAQQQPCKIDPL